MKKLLSLVIVVLLLLPVIAQAEENPEPISPAPTGEVTTESVSQPETTSAVEPRATPVFSLELFGYTIAVSEVDGLTTVALLKKSEDGTYESVAVYDFGGALGRTVSTVARTVSPGPAHGKVVSAFVRAVNEQRKEKKREEIEQRKKEGKENRERIQKEEMREKGEGKGKKERIQSKNRDEGEQEGGPGGAAVKGMQSKEKGKGQDNEVGENQ